MVQNNFNAATQVVTIFDPSGKEHACSRLNALDLVRANGFTWKREQETAIPAAAVEPEPKPAPAEEPAEVQAEEEKELDLAVAPLSDIAAQINGTDVPAYLDGFTAEALRDMAEQRYGEKIHRRTGKEKAVEKIVELEEKKLASEAD